MLYCSSQVMVVAPMLGMCACLEPSFVELSDGKHASLGDLADASFISFSGLCLLLRTLCPQYHTHARTASSQAHCTLLQYMQSVSLYIVPLCGIKHKAMLRSVCLSVSLCQPFARWQHCMPAVTCHRHLITSLENAAEVGSRPSPGPLRPRA